MSTDGRLFTEASSTVGGGFAKYAYLRSSEVSPPHFAQLLERWPGPFECTRFRYVSDSALHAGSISTLKFASQALMELPVFAWVRHLP